MPDVPFEDETMNRQFDMCSDCSCSSNDIVRHGGCPQIAKYPAKRPATPPNDRGVMLLGAVLLALFWVCIGAAVVHAVRG